jgi:hypothetical protein
MSVEKCPKCSNYSVIETPMGRILKESFGSSLHIANEYRYDCLHKGCGYKSEFIREYTELGKRLLLPWWKKMFLWS